MKPSNKAVRLQVRRKLITPLAIQNAYLRLPQALFSLLINSSAEELCTALKCITDLDYTRTLATTFDNPIVLKKTSEVIKKFFIENIKNPVVEATLTHHRCGYAIHTIGTYIPKLIPDNTFLTPDEQRDTATDQSKLLNLRRKQLTNRLTKIHALTIPSAQAANYPKAFQHALTTLIMHKRENIVAPTVQKFLYDTPNAILLTLNRASEHNPNNMCFSILHFIEMLIEKLQLLFIHMTLNSPSIERFILFWREHTDDLMNEYSHLLEIPMDVLDSKVSLHDLSSFVFIVARDILKRYHDFYSIKPIIRTLTQVTYTHFFHPDMIAAWSLTPEWNWSHVNKKMLSLLSLYKITQAQIPPVCEAIVTIAKNLSSSSDCCQKAINQTRPDHSIIKSNIT